MYNNEQRLYARCCVLVELEDGRLIGVTIQNDFERHALKEARRVVERIAQNGCWIDGIYVPPYKIKTAQEFGITVTPIETEYDVNLEFIEEL
jgi:hypothetical protein